MVALTAWATPLAGQSTALPPRPPPAADRLSLFSVDLSRLFRFTTGGKSWAPGVHADIAAANSHTRIGVGAARLSALDDGGSSSIGVAAAVTQVLIEKDSPNRMVWVSLAVGGAGLGHERLTDASVVDGSLSVGVAQIMNFPSIGEVVLAAAPRVQYRRFSGLPGLDRSASGVVGTLTLDWASQGHVGARVAMDVDWLSERPPGLGSGQVAFSAGVTYRLLLFKRRVRPPPPDEP